MWNCIKLFIKIKTYYVHSISLPTKLVILSVNEMCLVQHDLFLMSPCCLFTSYFPSGDYRLSALLIVLAIYQLLSLSLSVCTDLSNSVKITAHIEHSANIFRKIFNSLMFNSLSRLRGFSLL